MDAAQDRLRTGERAPARTGTPIHATRTPDGPVRNLPFGAAEMITYLILADQQRVDVLLITWSG